MSDTRTSMTEQIAGMQDYRLYRELHWEGSFDHEPYGSSVALKSVSAEGSVSA